MKFLLDATLSVGVAAAMRELGMTASHVTEVGLEAMDDEALLDWARREGYVAITRGDFKAILARTKMKSPSVIQLRVMPMSDADLAASIRNTVATLLDDLEAGAVVTKRVGK